MVTGLISVLRSRAAIVSRTGVLALACFAPVAHAVDALALQDKALARYRALRDTMMRGAAITGASIDRVAVAAIEADLRRADDALCAQQDWAHCAKGLLREGNLRGLQADKAGAIERFVRAADAGRKARDAGLEANALSEKSRVELESVNLGQAMADAVAAVRLSESSDDQEVRAKAFGSLGSVQRMQGDLLAAAESSRLEVEAALQAPDRYGLYFAYQDRYSVYLDLAHQCRRQRDYEGCGKSLEIAEDSLNRAVQVAESLGYVALVKNASFDRAALAVARQELRSTQSSEALLASLKTAQPKSPRDVWSNERIVPAKGAMSPDALNLLKVMKARLRDDFGDLARADDPNLLSAEGFIHEQEGDNDAATVWYLKAVDALERDRRTVTDEAGRGGFIAPRVKIYESAALHLLQQKRYAEAYTMVERSRSRVLADMLATQPLRSGDPRANALFAQQVALRARIADAQASLFAKRGGDGVRDDAALVAKQKQLRDDEEAYRTLLARAAVEAPQLTSLTTAATSDYASLQKAMRDEGFETLQFIFGPNGLVIWHASADASYAVNVLVVNRSFLDSIASLSASVADPNRSFDDASARALFLWMINPVLSHLRAKRLVIIPGDTFANLPFQVLVDPADGRPLGERFRISYAPSGTLLLGLRRSAPLARARVLALANPELPNAQQEIASIRAIFDGNGRFDAARTPREADVKRWVADADVVHLAVHGNFSKARPMDSSLQLAPGDGDDGALSANEMFGLPMRRKPLVVLSACETGIGASTASGEVLGMSRALLFAGANALVLARWEVDSESTVTWMDSFYRAALTKAPDEAAQLASNRLRADPATRHPHYWAPFYVVAR